MPKRASEERRNGLVSASTLARHLSCTRQYVSKLTAAGVIERRHGYGYDQDQCRLRYLAHLRSENRRSPRAAADAEHASAKAALLRLVIAEKQRKLVLREDANELIDSIAGLVLTHLGGLSARCSRDLVVRRQIDATVHQVRREIAEACSKMADERGEPALAEQRA